MVVVEDKASNQRWLPYPNKLQRSLKATPFQKASWSAGVTRAINMREAGCRGQGIPQSVQKWLYIRLNGPLYNADKMGGLN